MRLTVVIHNIRGGGSVAAATAWANEWVQQGHVVNLLCISPSIGDGKPFHVHPDVSLHIAELEDRPVTSTWRAGINLAGNLWKLRRLITKTRPDIVVAFDGPVNVRTLMACYKAAYPIVVMEQVHPAHHPLGDFWERWRKRMYLMAASLVTLTADATTWCAKEYAPRRTATIFNPVHPLPKTENPEPKYLPERRTCLTAGRFTLQKGFDMLIPAFASVADRHPKWDLVIYGEGEERENLEKLVAEHSLENRISLPGWADNLPEKMRAHDFFILSSRYEGFGNVIGEAMIAGLPVVSFDCPSGPSTIIRHDVDGLMVPAEDTNALADAISRLMGDDDTLKRLGARAPEVIYRFTMKESLRLWDAVFDSISN